MKKKLMLVPGVRYKGYAVINEYGQIEFDPEDKGAHEGRIKLVKTTDDFTVRESQRYVLLSIKIERKGGIIDRVQSFMKVVNNIISVLKEYDF